MLVAARKRREEDRLSMRDHPAALADFREALTKLQTLPLAALLRELGAVLYNREIAAWRVLVDVSDELIDHAMLEARARMTEQWLAQPYEPQRRVTPRMRARLAKLAEERGEAPQ